jgi:hypothetical protein
MTTAEAVWTIESELRLLGISNGRTVEALAALRPKPRKPKDPNAARAREIEKHLRRPAGFGFRNFQTFQETAYLNTFGPKDSPERNEQARRVVAMREGPRAADYGCPERPEYDAQTPYEVYGPLMDAHRAAVSLWKLSDDGKRFEAAQDHHEARRQQFEWQGFPKKNLDEPTRRMIMDALLVATS